MNALVQDRDGHIVDLMGGKQDIINHLIRAIDDPKKRFKEDALRILRAVRFVGKLNFNIEEHTLESMIEDVHLLKKIPRERVLKELEMIFNQTHIQNVYHLLDAIHLGDVFDELDQAIHLLKHSNKHYAIEAVFALGIYPQMRVDKNHWRLSNKQQWTIEEVLRLMHVLEYQTINPAVAFQHDQSHILLADELLSQFFNINSQRDEIMNTYNQLTIHSIQDLSITGQLIQPLVHNHKDVGHIIDALVEAVLYERIENNQKDLLNYARNLAEALNETK
jgi:tRNA nucleotidyltransferase (CCA-adding enzyme)